MNLSRFKIGMRTIKTGIAIILSLWLTVRLNIDYPIFTTISVITTMQLTVHKSLKEAKNVVITTIFGAVVGIIFATYLPHNDLFGGLGVIAVMHILYVLKLDDMITVSALVFLGTFLSYGEELNYALSRLYASLLGVGIALIVNYLIASVDLDEYAKREIKDITSALVKYVGRTLNAKDKYELEYIKEDIIDLRNRISALNIELCSSSEQSKKRVENLRNLRVLSQALSNAFWLCELDGTALINAPNTALLIERFGDRADITPTLSQEDNTVYNYHLNKFFKCISKLEEEQEE